MPGYKLHREPMLYFSGFKEHYSLFAASGMFFATLENGRIAKLRAAGIAATL